MKRIRIGLTCAVLAAAGMQAQAGMVDAKLLDMLLANGSITSAQHAELSADLAAETAASAAAEEQAKVAAAAQAREPAAASAFEQAAAWAGATAFKGDVRVRHEHTNIQDEPVSAPDGSDFSFRDKDRQRMRVRLGAFTNVNDQVSTGIQLASGNSADQRSTNQSFDNNFEKKSIWLDLGYIDFHPDAVPGLNVVGGKMKQPWVAVGDIVWDGDVNPEGFAAKYTRSLDAATLFGSAGYFVLKDGVFGDGIQFQNDLSLYALQGGVTFNAGEQAKVTLGVSMNDYSGDGQRLDVGGPITVPIVANGNTTDKFKLYEGFGRVDLAGLSVPLAIFGQYVVNQDARDYSTFTDGNEDTAWLVGFQARVAGVGVDYSYRDIERNAVVGFFTDSDFAAGYTGSNGHRLKVDYDLVKNLNFSVTWYLADSDVASRFRDDAEVETFMIDLSAKF